MTKITIDDVHLGPADYDTDDIKVLVCDIDGTVADLTHRRHWVMTKPKNWKAFETTLHLDLPIEHVISVVNEFHKHGTKIIMCSGRGEQNRKKTKDWLYSNGVLFHELYMRKEKDYRSDTIVKHELLLQMMKDGFNPDLVLDDRDSVVEMWRRNGLTCVQVAEGDF